MFKKCPFRLRALILVLIFITSFAALAARYARLQNVGGGPAQVYVGSTNLFTKAFTEPFESLFMICADGTIYRVTTQEDQRIGAGVNFLVDLLSKDKRTLCDVILIVHNHFGVPLPSIQDILFMKECWERGYAGPFGIWATPQGKMIIIRKKGI